MLQTMPCASSSDAALRRSAEVDAQHVRVSVDGPIVTLSGHMRSCHEKQEAERAAWAAPGVTHVENLMVVAPYRSHDGKRGGATSRGRDAVRRAL
jgi:hypothetical protein